MENDNIKKDENLQEETVHDLTAQNEAVKEAENTVEEDLIGDEWKTEDIVEEGEFGGEAEAVEDNAEAVEEIELSEEELAELEEEEKKKRKKHIIIGISVGAVVAVVLAVAAWFVCYTQGVGEVSVVNLPSALSGTDEENKASSVFKTDNIRYENPAAAILGNLTDKNKNTVMTVNGKAVDKDILNYWVNYIGVDYMYSLAQSGGVSDIKTFDWNTKNDELGMSYIDFVKATAVKSIIPTYAIAAEGEKNGIEFTSEDDKVIKDWIAQQKADYGDEFESIVKKSGYADEDALYENQKISVYAQKVYEDIMANPSKYITSSIKKEFGKDHVTVKHILIGFEQSEDGTVSDEAKAKAKKTAEEVLAKANAGEDFDQLIEKYNTDPGATDEGYTFAQDGSMVKPFEDASFALKVGQISGLVETDYGYHIIKRMDINVTADDYIEILQDKVPVVIKKDVYKNMKFELDLNDFFGEPEQDAPAADAETE